jgi:hypothetical protein
MKVAVAYFINPGTHAEPKPRNGERRLARCAILDDAFSQPAVSGICRNRMAISLADDLEFHVTGRGMVSQLAVGQSWIFFSVPPDVQYDPFHICPDSNLRLPTFQMKVLPSFSVASCHSHYCPSKRRNIPEGWNT